MRLLETKIRQMERGRKEISQLMLPIGYTAIDQKEGPSLRIRLNERFTVDVSFDDIAALVRSADHWAAQENMPATVQHWQDVENSEWRDAPDSVGIWWYYSGPESKSVECADVQSLDGDGVWVWGREYRSSINELGGKWLKAVLPAIPITIST